MEGVGWLVAYGAALAGGLGVGVGVNALADQVEGDEEVVWRAGRCRVCHAPLPARRMFPLVNMGQAARTCRVCGKVASLRRPALELALAALFPLLLAHLAAPANATRLGVAPTFLLDAAGLAALAFIFAVDLEHRLILDVAVFPALGGLLAVALIWDRKTLPAMLFGAALCGLLFLLFYGLGFALYREEALGFGDVKLAALAGALAGWPGALTLLIVAALAGAAVSLLLLGLGVATRRTFIPFGVFLALGAALALTLARPVWG